MTVGIFLLLSGVTVVSMAIHSVMGFGFAQLLGPVVLAVRPAPETVTALLAMAVVINAMVAVDRRPREARWAMVTPLLPGAAVGLPLGALMVTSIEKPALQVCSGLVIVAAAMMSLTASERVAAETRPPKVVLTGTAGVLSGAFTTATGIGAAPAILWLERFRPSKEAMRWAIAAYSLVLCLAGVAVLLAGARQGGAGSGVLLAVSLTPFVVLGHLVGRWVFRRIDAAHYRAAVLVLVTASGVATILAGVL